jgi:hypothetical protein
MTKISKTSNPHRQDYLGRFDRAQGRARSHGPGGNPHFRPAGGPDREEWRHDDQLPGDEVRAAPRYAVRAIRSRRSGSARPSRERTFADL